MAKLSVLFLFGVSALLCSVVVSQAPVGMRLDEELGSQAIPVEAMSQCADQRFCDNSTPGTGHGRGLFSDLTDDVVAVERCYSYCFSQLEAAEADFSVDPFPEVYRLEGSCSEAYVCFLACSLNLPTSATLLRNITQLSESATCSELCTTENGICDRAFPTTPECARPCKEEMCPTLCSAFETEIPVPPEQDVPDAASNPFSLMYAEDFSLARQGALEFTIPDQQPDGTAYGVIWRVQYNNGQNIVEYIPQHLPFHFLPSEVGPLHRVGSNMLSIRQLQCLPGVNLSYALVNVVGVSEFSEPQEQCFYGNAFPQPPTGIHVRFGFVEETPELRLEVWVDQPSTDADVVTGYGLQVFTLDSSGELSQNHQVLFPNNDLYLVVSGTSEVEKFLPTYYENTTYLFGVFALPQANESTSYPASNWVKVHTGFPPHPLLNGTECYSVTRDHFTGLANITIQFKVHTGWKSLVTVGTIKGELSIAKVRMLRFGSITQSVLFYPHSPISVEPAQSIYTLTYINARPTFGTEFFRFQPPKFTKRFENVRNPQVAGSGLQFTVKPLPPSPVVNLQVCYTLTHVNQSSVLSVEVQWEAPLWPEGEIKEYGVLVNSTVVMGNTSADVELMTDSVKTSNYSFELSTDEDWQGQPIAVRVRALSTVKGVSSVTAGEWAMVSLPQFANSTLRCISTESRADQTGPEEVESDDCGIFATVTENPTISTGSYDAAVLPNMVAVVLGLVCVLGTLRLFH